MKTVSLRDVQRYGAKALRELPCVVAGRSQKFVVLPLTPQNRASLMALVQCLEDPGACPLEGRGRDLGPSARDLSA